MLVLSTLVHDTCYRLVPVSMDSTVHYLQSQQFGNMETSLERVEDCENAHEDEWKNIQVVEEKVALVMQT